MSHLQCISEVHCLSLQTLEGEGPHGQIMRRIVLVLRFPNEGRGCTRQLTSIPLAFAFGDPLYLHTPAALVIVIAQQAAHFAEGLSPTAQPIHEALRLFSRASAPLPTVLFVEGQGRNAFA